MEFDFLNLMATIVVWAASAIVLLLSPALAESFADWFDEKMTKLRGKREGHNYKHGDSPHRERLLRHGVRNFCMVIFAIVIPAAVLTLSLNDPWLFYLKQGPAIVMPDGDPASTSKILIFVAEQALLGVGDFLEVFEFSLTDADASTGFIAAIIAAFRLYLSIFGAVVFYGFVFVVIDRMFIWVRLWPGANKKGEPVRINLSGLSRGYDGRL